MAAAYHHTGDEAKFEELCAMLAARCPARLLPPPPRAQPRRYHRHRQPTDAARRPTSPCRP